MPAENDPVQGDADLATTVGRVEVCLKRSDPADRFRKHPPSHPWQLCSGSLDDAPPAEGANDGAIMEHFVTVPGVGKVRITARRMKHKRGHSTHYFWTAESASRWPEAPRSRAERTAGAERGDCASGAAALTAGIRILHYDWTAEGHALRGSDKVAHEPPIPRPRSARYESQKRAVTDPHPRASHAEERVGLGSWLRPMVT